MTKTAFRKMLKTLKAGTKISFIYDGVKQDGKIQKEGGEVYICQNCSDGNDCNDKLGFAYSYSTSFIAYMTGIELTKKTFRTLEVGDKVKYKNGDDRFILVAVGGEENPVYMYSNVKENIKDADTGAWLSAYEMEENGSWTIVGGEEEDVEVTLKEIAEWKNVDIKSIKVKD